MILTMTRSLISNPPVGNPQKTTTGNVLGYVSGGVLCWWCCLDGVFGDIGVHGGVGGVGGGVGGIGGIG